MTKIGVRVVIYIGLFGMPALAPLLIPSVVIPALASPAGDACRKEICDSAVAACMRTDQPLNPLAGTEAEKKTYCAQFLPGCMSRMVTPDVPWYSPETVARFLKCPS
jgi:hypothetical protein